MKQRTFVDEYLVDLNASAAARRAGYSESSASTAAMANLHNPAIKQAIEEAIRSRAVRTRITQDWVLSQLEHEATYVGEGASHAARVSALEKIGKHLAMFTDKFEHTARTIDVIYHDDASGDP